MEKIKSFFVKPIVLKNEVKKIDTKGLEKKTKKRVRKTW